MDLSALGCLVMVSNIYLPLHSVTSDNEIEPPMEVTPYRNSVRLFMGGVILATLYSFLTSTFPPGSRTLATRMTDKHPFGKQFLFMLKLPRLLTLN